MNPGIDLLMAAPWDMVVMDAFVEDTPLPELTGVMPVKAVEEETVIPVETGVQESEDFTPVAETLAIPATSMEITKSEQDTEGKWNPGILKIYGITLSSVLVVVIFAGFLLNHHRKKNQ